MPFLTLPPPFPLQAVKEWQERIESSQGDVWRVLKDEREEKELRKAEMEATKMQVRKTNRAAVIRVRNTAGQGCQGQHPAFSLRCRSSKAKQHSVALRGCQALV